MQQTPLRWYYLASIHNVRNPEGRVYFVDSFSQSKNLSIGVDQRLAASEGDL